MSWTDDIRCLYCDGRLPLYRKITNGQFCSSAHRKAYWQEQERLAVERLHQTHNSLRAYRPAGAVEAILGQTAAAPEPERPRWLTLVNTGQIPMIGFSPDPTPVHPCWMAERNIAVEPMPIECAKIARRPVFIYRAADGELVLAGPVRIAPARRDSLILLTAALEPAVRRVDPIRNLALNFVPEGELLVQLVEVVQEEIPEMAGLLALPQPAFPEPALIMLRIEAWPLAILLRTHLPLDTGASLSVNGLPACSHTLPLSMFGIANCAGSHEGVASPLELRGQREAPAHSLFTPPARPRLRLATGSRYAVRTQKLAKLSAAPAPLLSQPAAACLPERRAKLVPARASKQTAAAAPMQEPAPAGLVALPCTADPKASGSPVIARFSASSFPQPPRLEAMSPVLRVEPMQETPGPSAPAGFSVSLPPYAHLEAPADSPRTHVWTAAIDFWNRAPRDLKMLAFAIPVLLALALHPGLPKVRTSSPADTTGMQRGFEQAVSAQWTNVRQTLVDRAAIALDEDFRSGLDDWASRWTTRGEGNAEWSFDQTGFVRPGPLALYKPSVGLTDYQMQFLGMIDKKAMSWVVRAADFDNFYVVKLEVLKPGPLPTLGLTRYAVINGKAVSRVDTPVPLDVRPDTLYRVRMDIHGDEFLLMVQGQVIDSWSEPRLKHGGVGFFSARGEDSRIRWVQVTHQYDMLGRLCAYLAPISQSNGSLQP